MDTPIDFLFSGLAPQRAAEAAARRRIRALVGIHPGVQEWDVHVAARHPGERTAPEYAARVAARIDGEALECEARAADVLAALRLAFNSLEQELHAERDRVRARGFHWVAAVKTRLGLRPAWS